MRFNSKAVVVIFVFAVAIGGWFLYAHLSEQDSSDTPETLSAIDQVAELAVGTENKESAQLPSPEELLDAKPELRILKRLQSGSNADVNFYGKIADQHGEPVAGAEIIYSIPFYEVGILPAANRSEGVGTTTSDANGIFKVENAEGMYFIVREIGKQGYAMEATNRTFIYRRRTTDQVVHKPDPANPVIFHAWKKGYAAQGLKEGEDYWAYRTDGKFYKIPMNGLESDLQVHFELLGNEGSSDTPRQWRATLKLDGGGIVETPDLFMYEAPESGYQSEWVIVARENDRIERKFYFKAKNGKVYGRIKMTLRGYYGDTEENRNKGFIDYEYALSLTGSRNLLPADE